MMFAPQPWAEAFVRTLDTDAEEGLVFFRIIKDCLGNLPGALFGSSVASEFENAMAKAAEKINVIGNRALDRASSLMALLLKRDLFQYSGEIVSEIEKILERQKKIVSVIFESVYPPAPELEEEIKEAIKKRINAGEVRLEKKINPALMSGYRLKIGDERIDASVYAQLHQMEKFLAAGQD